jgi:membrane fusion protein (multidrug efflux system)
LWFPIIHHSSVIIHHFSPISHHFPKANHVSSFSGCQTSDLWQFPVMSKFSALRSFVCWLSWFVAVGFFLSPSLALGQGRPATAVTTMSLSPDTFSRSVVANGTLRAKQEIAIRPESSGRVIELHLEDGAEVAEGTLLVKLDDQLLKAELEAVEAELELAQKTVNRQSDLFQRGATSEDAVDSARSRLAQLEANRRLLQERIADTEIRAPFAGKLGLRAVSLGAFVSTSDTLTTLSSIQELEVDFVLGERYQQAVSTGTEVTLELRGFNKNFSGQITARAPRVDEATRTLTFRASVDNSSGELLPGNFARVIVPLENYAEALLIPATAVLRDEGTAYVFVVQDGKAARRDITIGVRTRDEVQVLEGLAPGDEVVVRGSQGLNPGSPVSVKNESADAASSQG